MSKTYLLVDTNNLFHRCKHVVSGDPFTKASMSLHIMINSLRKCWNKFDVDHLVFCMDSSSWRNDVYSKYKAHRKLKAQLKAEKDIEEESIFFDTLDGFLSFISSKTNATFLKEEKLEADDIIAKWVDIHPNDTNIIFSGDSDFIQLLSHNVMMYDGVNNRLITVDGYYDEDGNEIIDNRTKSPKKAPDPEWSLFLKIIRGDSTDSIMSAYPKVRETKIRDAFDDRHSKGYSWNNLMLQTYTDGSGSSVRVLDRYEENKLLIDLHAQPDDIQLLAGNLCESVEKKDVKQVGIHLMRFCKEYELENILKFASSYADMFQSSY